MSEEKLVAKVVEPVAEVVAEKVAAPNPVVEPTVNSDTAIKSEVDKIMKVIDIEDTGKLEQIKTELETKLIAERATSSKALEEFKAEIKKDYLNQLGQINTKLEEYSGRKGLVAEVKENPYKAETTEAKAEVKETDPFIIREMEKEEDMNQAKEFVKALHR